MSQIQPKINQLLDTVNQIVLDKQHAVKLAVSCLLADGHLLLQDLPGMGKTTLAHALAVLFGMNFNRVQFTNDMLPADILGMMVYDQARQEFYFRQGAVFTELLLADEINRSSPKTQSALLEAMEKSKLPKMVKAIRFLSHFLSSPPKTLPNSQAFIHCQNPNLTAF